MENNISSDKENGRENENWGEQALRKDHGEMCRGQEEAMWLKAAPWMGFIETGREICRALVCSTGWESALPPPPPVPQPPLATLLRPPRSSNASPTKYYMRVGIKISLSISSPPCGCRVTSLKLMQRSTGNQRENLA